MNGILWLTLWDNLCRNFFAFKQWRNLALSWKQRKKKADFRFCHINFSSPSLEAMSDVLCVFKKTSFSKIFKTSLNCIIKDLKIYKQFNPGYRITKFHCYLAFNVDIQHFRSISNYFDWYVLKYCNNNKIHAQLSQ